MSFLPMDLMMRRVQTNGEDSDTARFSELLYAAEFAVKLTTAIAVAGIEDDIDNHRYRLAHALVRADGVGEWAAKLDEALSGLASQHLAAEFFEARRIFNERAGSGSWQFEAAKLMQIVLEGFQPDATSLPAKVSTRTWFSKFAEVRNKTRGHGAPTPAASGRLVAHLERSLDILCSNNPFFSMAFAYLHRNLSGKYRVVSLGGDQTNFAKLKQANSTGVNLADGVYIAAKIPRRVDLIYTDINCSDFAVPNGDFNGRIFEVLSPISDTRTKVDASPYLATASERPASETEGGGDLDVIGNVFTNLPTPSSDYIPRPGLEVEVQNLFTNDRHPIVTLVGRGGIGKTSLALTVLNRVAFLTRFDQIIWFSARDVDLTISGPKVVKPKVLTEKEIAEQYLALVNGRALTKDDRATAAQTMARRLGDSVGGKTLFIFDNFETVRSPVDLFNWLDTHIRLPNKVVITSRLREFKADYPIEVTGMEAEEADALITKTCEKLKIFGKLTPHTREQIVDESSGHPYIIKIILGEIANTGKFEKPSNLLVRKDDILDALFERTYSNLTPMAARVFLTLCGWRSMVPQLAVEAVLLRHTAEGGDPEKAIDDLVRMSMIERVVAGDGNSFLSVPLTAALFGRRKLEVSAHRDIIESDVRFLQDIGPTVKTGLKDGIKPRIVTLFKKSARRVEEGSSSMEEIRPVLSFVARGYAPAWVLLADLELEVQGEAGLTDSAAHLRRFLESSPSQEEAKIAWTKLISIYRASNDVRGACNALLRLSESSDPSIEMVSHVSGLLNNSRTLIVQTDVVDRETLFKPMAGLFERYLSEADATDLSRLAWLHLHAGDETRALQIAELGAQREPENTHCQKLIERLDS